MYTNAHFINGLKARCVHQRCHPFAKQPSSRTRHSRKPSAWESPHSPLVTCDKGNHIAKEGIAFIFAIYSYITTQELRQAACWKGNLYLPHDAATFRQRNKFNLPKYGMLYVYDCCSALISGPGGEPENTRIYPLCSDRRSEKVTSV